MISSSVRVIYLIVWWKNCRGNPPAPGEIAHFLGRSQGTAPTIKSLGSFEFGTGDSTWPSNQINFRATPGSQMEKRLFP